jgi:hypothetical protein
LGGRENGAKDLLPDYFFAEAQTLFQCQPKQNLPLEELLSVELWGVCLTLLAR